MDHPFPKSATSAEKCKRLTEILSPDETWGIIMNADPDAIASALALKRLFWRKVRKVTIFHINPIERADNLALIRLLKIKMQRIRSMKGRKIHRWAIVDSQPHHHKRFMNHPFDIIIDHHPVGPSLEAAFIDIKEDYGANSTILTEYLRASKVAPSPRLSVSCQLENRFRHRCSSTYLRISPLHVEFRFLRQPSRKTVSNAAPRLSPGISHLTYLSAYAPFTPNNSD